MKDTTACLVCVRHGSGWKVREFRMAHGLISGTRMLTTPTVVDQPGIGLKRWLHEHRFETWRSNPTVVSAVYLANPGLYCQMFWSGRTDELELMLRQDRKGDYLLSRKLSELEPFETDWYKE